MKKKQGPKKKQAGRNASALLNGQERALLRAKLQDLLPLAQYLGIVDVEQAALELISVLDAPGPLERRKMLPLMMNFEARMKEAFQQGARETGGAVQAMMKGGIVAAEEQQAFYQEALDKEKSQLPD